MDRDFQVESYRIGTVAEFLAKVKAANNAKPNPLAIQNREPVASSVPTETVDFTPIRVIVDMWRIVQSPSARPAEVA